MLKWDQLCQHWIYKVIYGDISLGASFVRPRQACTRLRHRWWHAWHFFAVHEWQDCQCSGSGRMCQACQHYLICLTFCGFPFMIFNFDGCVTFYTQLYYPRWIQIDWYVWILVCNDFYPSWNNVGLDLLAIVCCLIFWYCLVCLYRSCGSHGVPPLRWSDGRQSDSNKGINTMFWRWLSPYFQCLEVLSKRKLSPQPCVFQCC